MNKVEKYILGSHCNNAISTLGSRLVTSAISNGRESLRRKQLCFRLFLVNQFREKDSF